MVISIQVWKSYTRRMGIGGSRCSVSLPTTLRIRSLGRMRMLLRFVRFVFPSPPPRNRLISIIGS